ncbi:hypothetical protein [Mycobacterium sp.]|uniref:hypothetical protein n=1 Tax=Mycobacterium sp. TaxID=1785 RepID=UPI003A863A50
MTDHEGAQSGHLLARQAQDRQQVAHCPEQRDVGQIATAQAAQEEAEGRVRSVGDGAVVVARVDRLDYLSPVGGQVGQGTLEVDTEGENR